MVVKANKAQADAARRSPRDFEHAKKQHMLRWQTLEEALEKMGRYSMLPKTSQAEHEAGVFTIAPPKYMKREVFKGALAPVGRFRGPLPMRTNASTLRLFGPGLASFAAWQVGAHWNAFYLVSRAWTGLGSEAAAVSGLLPACPSACTLRLYGVWTCLGAPSAAHRWRGRVRSHAAACWEHA